MTYWTARLITYVGIIAPLFLLIGSLMADEPPKTTDELRVVPASLRITNRRQPHSIIVGGNTEYGETVDFTRTAVFQSSNEKVARVNSLGWIEPISNGETEIRVQAADRTAIVKVVVELPEQPTPSSFRHDVMPVLSKAGCNVGACHGYSLGKKGFKLTLRGANAATDYQTLTDEFLERRINRHNPPASLLLSKPLGDVPHKGGVRFEHNSLLHTLILDWIAEGAHDDAADIAKFESVEIYPQNAVMQPGWQQQLQVIARFSDGTTQDVTRLSVFTINTQRVASVQEQGLVTAEELGETAISARFQRTFATATFIVLQSRPDFQPTPVADGNLIDKHVVEKLNDLKIEPSPLADDATFLRRVYIDLIGIQPTPEEMQTFLSDKDPNRRENVIDSLFSRPEFVDQWSLKWGDLLQNSRNHLSDPAVFAFREWIRSAVAANMPLDEFVREILTSRGGAMESPAAAFYAVSKDPHETLQRTTQVFCGVRMLCAKCHPHPFENWTQSDYYGLYNFFNQVSTKNDPRLPGVRNAKSIILNLAVAYERNPRTGQVQPPRFLGGEEPQPAAGSDRRQPYSAWLTSPDNPFFARSMTNRIWSNFFHRGIIEPVDDIRTTNPPINPKLLDALTADFVASKFDMRHLMKTIVSSQTYQRASLANETNSHDTLNFSRYVPRRLPAETLLDCLVQATAVAESFPGAPAGFAAKQLPDANIQSDFLRLFGKPQRIEACECERDDGSNMLQALHLINGKSILDKVSAGNGRVAQLVKSNEENSPLIQQLFLWSLVRSPTDAEKQLATEFFKSYGDKRLEAAQDFMWALLNSRDFTMVH